MFEKLKVKDGIVYLRVSSYTEFSTELQKTDRSKDDLKSNIMKFLSIYGLKDYKGDIVILSDNIPVGKLRL